MNVREIKFRIWNTTYCKMSETFTLEQFAYDQDGEMGDCQLNLNDGVGENRKENILMQFTGLHDKNGREIYEGDIVQKGHYRYGLDEHNRIVGQVTYKSDDKGCRYILEPYWRAKAKTWNNGTSWGMSADIEPDLEGWSSRDSNLIEIIGNIYENPELLK